MNELGTASSAYRNLTIVLGTLRHGIGTWAGRGVFTHVMALLVWGRVGRVCQAMERLAALFQAGRLVLRARRAVVSPVVAAVVARPMRLWPVQWAWLVRMIGWQAAGIGGQLQHVLGQPEMVALLRASPQARRLLRPICRMLAVPTALLRPVTNVGVTPVVVTPMISEELKWPSAVDRRRVSLPRAIRLASLRDCFEPVG